MSILRVVWNFEINILLSQSHEYFLYEENTIFSSKHSSKGLYLCTSMIIFVGIFNACWLNQLSYRIYTLTYVQFFILFTSDGCKHDTSCLHLSCIFWQLWVCWSRSNWSEVNGVDRIFHFFYIFFFHVGWLKCQVPP